MPIYQAATRSTLVGASAGSVLFGFHANSRRCWVREWHMFNITAPTTSGGIGLVRSTALGTGSRTEVIGIPRDTSSNAGTGSVVTAWATLAPTTGGVTTSLIRFTSPATFGNGVIWTFDDEPMEVPANPAVTSELVIINLMATAPGTYDFTVVWEE